MTTDKLRPSNFRYRLAPCLRQSKRPNIPEFIPCLKNTANQRPGLPLYILRYATGNMQRVVFHSTFPSFLARNSLLESICGLLKSELRNYSTPANHYEYFRSHPKIVSEDFQTPEDFRRFPKIVKSHKTSENYFSTVSEVLRKFPKISEHFRRYSKIFRKF